MIENHIKFQKEVINNMCLGGENSFIQPVNDLMSRHIERKDELLKEILNDYLGKDIFNCCAFSSEAMEMIKLASIYYKNGSEVFLFDGVPIVEFFPPTLNTENMKVTMSAKYRKLYEKRR